MERRPDNQIVHLELHTGDLKRARATYERLFDWRAEEITVPGGSYVALGVGERLGGGIVECSTSDPRWLPYVEVEEIWGATALASELGAEVMLGPSEGPGGWRSVVSLPAGGELALWQAKPGS